MQHTERLAIRACTGFDGGFEVVIAIRRPEAALKVGKLNLNANDKLAYAA